MKEKEISDFVLKHYNLQCDVYPLDSYIDRNYRLTSSDGRQYIFKISTETDSPEFLQDQNNILFTLTNTLGPERQFPHVIPTVDKKEIIQFERSGENPLNARLLSYVEGQFLGDVEYSSEILFDLGTFLGEMDQILQEITSPHIRCRNFLWDLQNFSDIEEFISLLKDVELRRLVRYFLMQFRESVKPVLRKLKKQTIHNDANIWNLLIHNERISGIIDFGDMVSSYAINELAIAITYAIMDKNDPVDCAVEIIRGYHSSLPLKEEEIQLLYYLIAARLSTSICMSTHSEIEDPSNEYITISKKPAIELLNRWIGISPVYANNKFREACGYPMKSEVDHTILLTKRSAFISSSLSLSYDEPIRMVKAAFQYMYDDKGNTYLDCVNNICHVGHCHPCVVEAGRKQMTDLNTNTRYIYENLNQYAEKLCSTLPEKLNKVFFLNSGSDASDLALRLARTHTNRENIIVIDHAYHGNTRSAIEVSPYKYDGKGGSGPVPSTHKTLIPDTFRGVFRKDDPVAGQKYALEVDKIIQSLNQKGESIAGFICESIVGCGGQVMLPKGYLPEVYRKVREAGGICLVDEVQVGFGRVGSKFWGFELYDVVPDIVIMGKPMGNGHPLAAVVTTEQIAQSFENGMEFFSSFGGNPVSCAIGEAVLDVISEEKLQENAKETGDLIFSGLLDLKQKYPLIGDVRGSGLFLGIEFVSDFKTLKPADTETKIIVEEMKKRRILLSIDGPYHNVIKFKPPMVFSRENSIQLLENLEEVLKRFQAK